MWPFKRREQKGLNPNQSKPRPLSGILTPLSINYKQDRAYESVSAVYTVVSYLMAKFSQVPIRVYKVADKTALKQYKSIEPYQYQRPSNYLKARKIERKALEQVDETNDLAKLLQCPNPVMSSDVFFQTLFGHKLLRGEGIIWGNRGELDEGNEKKPILEMYPLPPGIVDLVPDPNDVYGIKEWVVQLPQLRPLFKEDVINWRYPSFIFDPTTHSHLRGQSPLLAGRADLEAITALQEASKAMYANRGANGVLIAEDGMLTPEQVGKMVATINERVNGSSNAGTIGGLAGKWQFFDLSMSARDMELIEAQKYSVTKVANLYNVPAGIWDLTESANNNITQYRAQVFTDKLMGEWSDLLSYLNTWLLPAFGMEGTHYIGADYSEIPDLQADLHRMIDGVRDSWWITPNEKRELQGYEPSTDPLMDQHWVPTSLKPMDDAAINIDDIDGLDQPTEDNSQGRE